MDCFSHKIPIMNQRTVFRKIRKDIGRHSRAEARKRVPSYLKALYSPELEGKIYFYEQDQDGLPIRRTETNIIGMSCFSRFRPTMLVRNTLDALAWRNIDKPEDFQGGTWQPVTRADLLGCKTMSEKCAECDYNGRHNDSHSDDDYHAWVKRMFKVWHKHIDIRLTKNTGYGLVARSPIPVGIFLGEYTGMLVPIDDEVPDEETEYQFGIRIGKLLTHAKAVQPMCWVDATNKGSIFRFMAHSCEPNAEVIDARVAMHHRVLAVRTLRHIRANQPITIDYGREWFTGEQRCFCGTESCRNKPQIGDLAEQRK